MSASHLAESCFSHLRQRQNHDGGWGYLPVSQSWTEPTCWAVSALASARMESDSAALSRARSFLLSGQLQDGSWPSNPEIGTGSWVTSLACAVLSHDQEAGHATAAALEWLCKDLSRTNSPWLRLIRSLRPKSNISAQNDSLSGWGWTPGTSSWVEPTAFALLSIQQFRPERLPHAVQRRREIATAMLYDRMCPGGGWNCGNPRVYGVPGEALVLPTAWALIALRAFPDHERKSMSLAWLEAEFRKIRSPGSLAVAGMCLETYGRATPAVKLNLEKFVPKQIKNCAAHVLAWVCLALNSHRKWPAPLRNGN